MNPVELRALIVALRLLGDTLTYKICNEPIRIHSTGNFFHTSNFKKHKATILWAGESIGRIKNYKRILSEAGKIESLKMEEV